ncbi:MAG: adenine deaminase [Cytophagaceae bacterium]|jgi:adenine deaminase|nr:adenine deaminase [Cytophagaceae bacterium]
MKTIFSIKGQIVDLFERKIYSGELFVNNGIIERIEKLNTAPQHFILPGLVDSHVHIESSMLTPSRFAEMVIPRGTVAVVSDPHEIANVTGESGIQFMIDDAKTVPLKCFFGAPPCVPATSFETSGAVLDANAVSRLLNRDDIFFLSEMMNYPGVIYRDSEVMAKIDAALKRNKRIDGHAPCLSSNNLKKYIQAGISADHECSSLPEALEKINLGMKIQVREGSSAQSFNKLSPLFKTHPEALMLCTDDSHPAEIARNGHIDRIIKLGIKLGINIFDLLRSATIIPVQHYNLPVGLMRVGESADFIVVNNLNGFNVIQSFINGKLVYDSTLGITFSLPEIKPINRFRETFLSQFDIEVKLPPNKTSVKVIEVTDGELLTTNYLWKPAVNENKIVNTDTKDDILKIVVVNRYNNAKPVAGFIKNFGLKTGAWASSVAHDSHNIVAVGVDDKSIIEAINLLIKQKGGICAVDNDSTEILELPVAGIMSTSTGKEVSAQYKQLNKKASTMDTSLKAPFMTLSFMSLLVIPHLKISDKGLFDVDKFEFVELFE